MIAFCLKYCTKKTFNMEKLVFIQVSSFLCESLFWLLGKFSFFNNDFPSSCSSLSISSNAFSPF